MSDLRFTHDKHCDKAIAIQAILIAVFLHAFLLMVFYIPDDDLTKRVLSNKHIRMFDSSKSAPMGSNLQAILYYGDPTVISKPKFSYSIEKKENFADVPDVILPRRVKAYIPKVSGYRELKSPRLLVNKSSALVGSYPTLYKQDFNINTELYPKAINSEGQVLNDFTIPEQFINNLKKEKPNRATIYKIIYLGDGVIPRVVVYRTSGKLVFDQLGVQQLLQYLSSQKNRCGVEFISIIWQKCRSDR